MRFGLKGPFNSCEERAGTAVSIDSSRYLAKLRRIEDFSCTVCSSTFARVDNMISAEIFFFYVFRM